jgi:Na+-driven multidrug efflux pump
VVLGTLVQVLAIFNLDTLLASVLSPDAPAYAFAKPYLLTRCYAFLPLLICMVAFSAFRGILDSVTPVKITLLVAGVNVLLSPLLIVTFRMGVAGSALASVVSETVGACVYLILLCQKDLINPVQMLQEMPSSHGNVQKWWTQIKPLLQGGASLQLKSLATNMAFVSIARTVQGSDETGVSASAHAMATQLFQLGSVALASASMVTQTLVPNEMVVHHHHHHKSAVVSTGAQNGNPVQTSNSTFGGPRHARNIVNRLFAWGLILGFATCIFQLGLTWPMMHQSTPLHEVREASWMPCILASLGQIINGPVFIGEGIMIGTGSFLQLSIVTALSSFACVAALNLCLAKYGVNGVWLGFVLWNALRLVGVYIHDRINGPLAPRKIAQAEARGKED